MRERRFFRGAQLRATEDSSGKKSISGYAAVFNQEYDSGYFIETIKSGAFSKVLASNPDVRCLFNHDPNHVLGRTKSGSLKLVQDDSGLRFENQFRSGSAICDEVHGAIKAGDIDGCSFSFIPSKVIWREEKDPSDPKRTLYYRDIEEFDVLFDAGPVTFPAYTGTSVAARAAMVPLMFPEGLSPEFRSQCPASVLAALAIDARSATNRNDELECRCDCRACFSAECNECSMHMNECGDEDRCGHMDERADKKTKRVDGEDLPASAFLYVGDPEKTATWSLPWKFSTEEKCKSHLRNALARFNQTSNIPADDKPKVWKKLVAKCKKYDIKVTDDEAKSFRLTAEQRDQIGSGDDCQCACPECQVGNHDDCSDPDCEGKDDGCDHGAADSDEESESDRARLRMHLADID